MFESHTVTVVEADGIYTEPYEVEGVEIAIAQRYSVLLTAKQAPSNYWVHAQTRFGRLEYGDGILRYKNAQGETPSTDIQVMIDKVEEHPSGPQSDIENVYKNLSAYIMEWESGLKTLTKGHYSKDGKRSKGQPSYAYVEDSPPSYFDKEFHFSLGSGYYQEDGEAVTYWDNDAKEFVYLVDQEEVENSGKYFENWGFNDFNDDKIYDINWRPGQGPLMFNAYLDNWDMLDGGKPPLVLDIEEGEVIQIVLENYRRVGRPVLSRQHPMHLHGHVFWVMGQGVGDYNSSVELNYDRTLKRDSQTLYPYSWLVLRFVADNPGMWMFHCHNSGHDMSGMRMAFNEIPSEIPPPPKDFKLCGPFNIGTLEDVLPQLLGDGYTTYVDYSDEDMDEISESEGYNQYTNPYSEEHHYVQDYPYQHGTVGQQRFPETMVQHPLQSDPYDGQRINNRPPLDYEYQLGPQYHEDYQDAHEVYRLRKSNDQDKKPRENNNYH